MANYLLDTHAFLWWLDEPERLSKVAQQTITNLENTIYVSVVNIWEIAIKAALGKLEMPVDLLGQVRLHEFEFLLVSADHAVKPYALPLIHNDPFDRLLISQSIIEDLPLITHDKNIQKYDIPLILT